MYSEKVMDHFSNPRNVGVIENADGVGEEGNPVCGDMMTFYIKVEDGKLADVKYKTFGCGAAIAVSSMLSVMAVGKTLAEAMHISRGDVAESLDGLPKQKLHCSNLGADALRKAIEDYLTHHPEEAEGIQVQERPREQVYEERFGGAAAQATGGCQSKEGSACCPFCDAEIPADSRLCGPCGQQLEHCPNCNAIVPANAHDCPQCGTDLEH